MKRSAFVLGFALLIAACATSLMQENEAEAGVYFHAGVGFGIGHSYPAYGYGYAPAYYSAPVYAAPTYYTAPVTYAAPVTTYYAPAAPVYHHSYYAPPAYWGYGYGPHYGRGELEIEYKFRNGYYSVEYDYDD